MSDSIANYEGLKYNKESFHSVEDSLVVEAALQISINNEPYTITMQSPGNELELIRGLLYAEDIYRRKDIPLDSTITHQDEAITSVNLNIPKNDLGKGYRNSRSILSVSSCGICGKRELDDIEVEGERLVAKDGVTPQFIEQLFAQMNQKQETFKHTGGSHAAAAFSIDGKLLCLREDIGRHNAVDKVVGALLNAQQIDQAKCLLVSGRVSYEIITKAFVAKIPILAAVSAPSSLAVDFAKELGITLIAFCRSNKATCYANPYRFKEE